MIGKITGNLIEVDNNIGLLQTASGICFELYLTPLLISQYKPNSKIEIYTYLQVRDDAFVLFGFESKSEKNFFKLLLSVPGVGPKTAFSIISHSKIDEILDATKNNKLDYFTKIPGLGKKTALKIILELSQKIKSEFSFDNHYLTDDDKTAIKALISLGYPANEAKTTISQLPKNLSLENKIKEALKNKS